MNIIRRSILTAIPFFLMVGCSSPDSRPEESVVATDSAAVSEFDAKLAEELGADQYGMRTYVMAFLKRGPNRETDPQKAAELQRAHLDNIRRLAEEGKLVLAGPFLDDGEIRGIYIFDVTTVEEARKLTSTDPAIQSGQLEMELHPWYGSAALVRVNEMHSAISRENP